MLSLMVGAGSFHSSKRANGGNRPKPAIIRPLVHDMSTVMATTVAMNTHTADTAVSYTHLTLPTILRV